MTTYIYGANGTYGNSGVLEGENGLAGGNGETLIYNLSGDLTEYGSEIRAGSGGGGGNGATGAYGTVVSSYSYNTYNTNGQVIGSYHGATYSSGGTGGSGASGGAGGAIIYTITNAQLHDYNLSIIGGGGGTGGYGGRGGDSAYTSHFDDGTNHTDITGGAGGNGGNAGIAGAGGDATLTVSGSTLASGTSNLSLSSMGGSGSGYYYNTGGMGGNGAVGGNAGSAVNASNGGNGQISFMNNQGVVDGPVLSFSAYGGTGGYGANGSYGGFGVSNYYTGPGGVNHTQSVNYGANSSATPGGNGGDAILDITGNTIHTTTNGNSLSLSAYAFAGSGGPGGVGPDGVAATSGIDGHASVAINNNNFYSNSMYISIYEGFSADSLNVSGNIFSTLNPQNSGNFQFYINKPGAHVVLDVNAHTLTVNGSVNTIYGFNNYSVIAVGGATLSIVSGTAFGAESATPAEGVEGGWGVHNGQWSFSDANTTETHTVSVSNVTSMSTSDGRIIPLATQAALASAASASIVFDTNRGAAYYGYGSNLSGVVHYDLTIDDALLDFLKLGEDLNVSYNLSLTDGSGGTVTKPLNFIIHGANDTPQAVNDQFTASVDTPLILSTSALLANDTDVDGDTLSVNAVYSAINGTVQLSGNQVIFTPDQGYVGQAQFSYQIDDGNGRYSTAWASIDVAAGVNLTGTTANDALNGTAYDDVIIGLAGNDTLKGFAGDDILGGGLGNDILDGGAGLDTANYADATAVVKVSLALTSAQNTGGAGTDTLSNIENLLGSDFNDTLTGNASDNQLDGGKGNDKLNGGVGTDHLLGGDGTDTLDGGVGADLLEGGLGNDVYTVDDVSDQVIESDPLGGIDTVKSGVSFTLGANVEKLTLTGLNGIDGTGNTLANTIIGNNGDNVLKGGAGKDVLTGGLGADTFVFDVLETTANKDTIKDFVSGTDHIELATSAFSALSGYGLGTLDPGELSYGTKALTTNDHLIYNSSTGALYFDVDGVGGAAQIQIAVLSNHAALSAGDFILI